MAKCVEDVLYSKRIEKSSDMIISAAMQVKEIASQYGEIDIEENRIMTSKRGNTISIRFCAKRDMDNVICPAIYFVIVGEGERMVICMKGVVRACFGSEEETFRDFYMKEIYPQMAKKAKKALMSSSAEIEKQIRSL